MINILKSGRLGNNLFQFAFGLTLSKKLKTDFIFDTSSIDKYFVLGNYNNPILKKIRYIRYLFSLKFNSWKTIDLNLDVAPTEILPGAHDHAVIYGYFQSADFFKENLETVKNHFKIKNRYLETFNNNYGQLFQKPTVCVAIRLTDYASWKIDEIDGKTPELSFEYFKKQINKLDDIESKNLIVVSDNVDDVRSNLKLNNAIYIKEEVDTLIALSLSDELIISNSSFHWWGAWLNNKPNKTVYAPKYWLGHKVKREYPKNVIPVDWIQVEV